MSIVRGPRRQQRSRGATLGEAVAQEEPEPTQVAPPPRAGLGRVGVPWFIGPRLEPREHGERFGYERVVVCGPGGEACSCPSGANGYRGPSLNGGAKPTSVKVPREIWVPLRNARVFEVQDPLERYRMVAANHDRRDVVDLHFRPSRTAPVVLQHVLDTAIRANPSGVWVVTGSGHHAPRNSHQQKKAAVQLRRDYLAAQGRPVQSRRTTTASPGAHPVQGPPRHGRAAVPATCAPYRTGARTACRRRRSRPHPRLERRRRGVHTIALFVVGARRPRRRRRSGAGPLWPAQPKKNRWTAPSL